MAGLLKLGVGFLLIILFTHDKFMSCEELQFLDTENPESVLQLQEIAIVQLKLAWNHTHV